eukprot:635528-Amphidinium_carterae.1
MQTHPYTKPGDDDDDDVWFQNWVKVLCQGQTNHPHHHHHHHQVLTYGKVCGGLGYALASSSSPSSSSSCLGGTRHRASAGL